MAKKQPAKRSKYEEPIHVPATPEQVARSLFRGKPKPKEQWSYLKRQVPENKS